MSLAKNESSSYCKGKEVTIDDLPLKEIGGEPPHSEEEQRGRDPSNEYPPLIDSWYDTHIQVRG